MVVRPETLIRWHRAGWQLFWRLKSRPGRPPIPQQLQALIRRIANENPAWGEERIANVIEHRSRRLIHSNVTAHPTAAWTLQQLREAIGRCHIDGGSNIAVRARWRIVVPWLGSPMMT